MSIIRAVKSLGTGTSVSTIPLSPATYRSIMSDLFLPGGQGPLQLFTYTDTNSAVYAYKNCPPLTAIINKTAQAYVNGKTWVMDDKGKESKTPYAAALRKLLARPNPLQTWTQFEAQQKIFVDMFGWCPLLPIYPFGRSDIASITSIWNIPTNICTPKETKKIWYQTDLAGIVDSIEISYKGEKSNLPLDKIFIFRDFVPSFNTMAFPDSRMCSLELPINNIIGAYKSRNVLINYRGALGILSADSDKNGYIPVKEEDKKALQNDFRRYGLLNEQWKFIITSAAVKWQQMGVPTRELMLFEEIQDDIYRCCDGYNYPSPLMSSDKNNALGGSNQDPAKQSLYQDCIIPSAANLYDQWNIFFKTSDNKCKLEKDYSHIPCLQANKVEQGRARYYLNQAMLIEWQNNLITANQWLEANGMDLLPGNEGDMFYYQWVAAGKIFGTGTPVVQQSGSTGEQPPNSNNNNP